MSTSQIAAPLPRRSLVSWSRWAPLPLPSIQSRRHAGASTIEWVVAGYALTAAVFTITAGWLGDRLGHRRMFSLGLFVFTLVSAACGMAATPAELVIARLLQGVAAALLTPSVLSIIGIVYQGRDRLRALSAHGTVMGFAAIGGQLIRGRPDRAGSGRARLARLPINLSVGVAALLLAPRALPASRRDRSARVDVLGTLLATATLTAIVLPLVEGRQHGWPAWTWASLGAGPLLLSAFVLHQHSGSGPLGLQEQTERQGGMLTTCKTSATRWESRSPGDPLRALHGGYPHAFELAAGELALLLLGVAALTRLLPAHARR